MGNSGYEPKRPTRRDWRTRVSPHFLTSPHACRACPFRVGQALGAYKGQMDHPSKHPCLLEETFVKSLQRRSNVLSQVADEFAGRTNHGDLFGEDEELLQHADQQHEQLQLEVAIACIEDDLHVLLVHFEKGVGRHGAGAGFLPVIRTKAGAGRANPQA